MSYIKPRPGMHVLKTVIGLTLIAAAALAILSQLLSIPTSLRMFAESGPFERISPWFWLLLAAFIPAVYRRPTTGVIAGMIVCVACAAREWDMHKSFTGYSVLKPGFYLSTDYPPAHQIVAGTIVLVVGFSALILLAKLFTHRPWTSTPRPAWLLALAFAVFMLALTKLLDRTPGIVRDDLGIELPTYTRILFSALEEGLELLLPLNFAALVLCFALLIRTDPNHPEPQPAAVQ